MSSEVLESLPKAPPLRDGMARIPGGSFAMGSEGFYPEESPIRAAWVEPFLIDVTPVTNRDFAAFVAATGYITLAELPPDPALYPGILPEMMAPGSIVFVAPRPGVPAGPESWWHHIPGANWRSPYGPQSGVVLPDDHPVVQIAFADAAAYAAWAGKRLPTEEEMEFAARGGLERAAYAWGGTLTPNGEHRANIWYEGFPYKRRFRPGPPYTTPVRTYKPNPYGVFDLIGNVWEWTSSDADAPPGAKGCCMNQATRDPAHRKILKGGSHLCAPNYCRRYRPAARWPQPVDTATTHVGFRCAQNLI